MSENTGATDATEAQAALTSTPSNPSVNITPRTNRPPNRNVNQQSSTSRDFEGATPKLGAILALRSENITLKTNYDRFLEKLATCIVNELKDGDFIVEITKNPKVKIIENFVHNNKPTELSDDEKEFTVDVEIHKEEIKEYVKDLKLMKGNLKKVYTIVFGNCTDSVQTMIKTDSEYEEKSKTFDHAWLFEKVKTIVSGLDTKVNLRVSLHDVMLNFMLLKQFPNETNEAHHTKFKSMIETLKIAGGEHLLVSPSMLGAELSTATDLQIRQEKEKYMAICFILRSDELRHKRLLEDLKRSANLGRDEYPETLTDAFDLLVRESGEYDTVRATSNRHRGRGTRGGRGRQNFLFAQQGRGDSGNESYTYSRMNDDNSNEIVAGTNGETFPNIACFGCNFHGHYRNMCPYATRSAVISMHVGCTLTQEEFFKIPKSWLLLDTCSTCDVSNNPNLVSNIRACAADEVLLAYTNGGAQKFEKLADLNILPITVHFKVNSMATILSFKTVSEIPGARLTMDTQVNKNITLTLEDGKIFVFTQYKNGLYFFDTKKTLNNSKPKHKLKDYSFLTTVSENKQYFSTQEIKGADISRKLQEYLFFPGSNTVRGYINQNLITNCEITADDVNRGVLIYGPLEPYVEGHMVRHKPPMHDKIEKIPLPPMVSEHHLNIALYIDFFFVNGNIFLHTKSNKVNFLTAQYCNSRSLRTIITVLEKVINKYECRSFNICDCHGDNEFDKEALRTFLEPALLHIYGRKEHVGPIERSVRTIKERFRSTCCNVPYRKFTILMVRSLVEGIVAVLNAFPSKNSISSTISPATIVEGKPKMDLKRKIIPFGAYALVYTETTNDNKPRAVPAIALRMSNTAGGHYFMSLHTGKRIHGFQWDELPIDEHVIQRVEALATEQKQPLMNRGKPCFEWSPGVEIKDIYEEEGEQVLTIANGENRNEIEEQPLLEMDQALDQGVEQNDVHYPDDAIMHDNQQAQGDQIAQDNEEGVIAVEEDNIVSEEEFFVESEEEADIDDGQSQQEVPNEEEVIVANLDDEDVAEQSIAQDRPRRVNAGTGVERLQMNFAGKGYGSRRELNFVTNGSTKKVSKKATSQETYMQIATDIIFTQMSAREGFKKHGQAAISAMIKEFTQLSNGAVPGKPVVRPIDVSSLTPLEKSKALPAVNLIKEKYGGVLKGRTCADGSGQRKYLKQDESVASPTAALESLIMSLVIDAYEGRDVAVFDIPGAYLQAKLSPKDNNEKVLMKLVGDFVDIMCGVNPEHKKNVVYENGRKVLYMEVLQAIYGCIESALRWYELFSKTLVKEGWTINPYDKCVANKLINGKQCTIVWYVDDNKVSHKDPKVVTKVIELMKVHFGNLTVTRGNKHRFLGMNITVHPRDKIEIEMKDQLQKAIDMFIQNEGEDVIEEVTSPATRKLREVNPECELLSEDKSDAFHSIVALLLWIMKRARPDLETAISYLCTRVSKSNLDDWGKLRRVIAFIKCTIDDVRIIGAHDLKSIFTWIDAAYAVNADMRSQTGGAMSMGLGVLHAKCSKQKLNVKSSTEAELVGTSEYLPYNLWLMMFMSEQGYKIKDNRLYQDNQSTILMLKNGRNSCTGNSRHIDIRYFFVKDRIDKGELKVEYCPSSIMLADFFTKPLQGQLFKKFRDVIMGHAPMSCLKHPSF